MTKIALLVGLGGIVGVVGFILVIDSGNHGSTNTTSPLYPNQQRPTKETLNIEELRPSSSPVPFQELTIPYLQSRAYQSQLGKLEPVQDRDAYTGYLTQYDSDGLRVNGLITIPKGETPDQGYPAVVFVHGYIPPDEYRTLSKYEAYVDYLARRGMVVFKIDLRGHGDSEGEPGGAYYSSDYVIDTLNAYSALSETDFVNPAKIGLWGHSMAGNVVLRAVAAQPDISRAVLWAGAVYTYSDMRQFSISDSSYQPPDPNSARRRERNQLNETHGSFDPESDFWRQVPATNYLDSIQAQIQIHHATDDAVVPIAYSRNLAEVVADTAIDLEIYEYTSGGHNLTGPTFNQAMSRTADFLRNWKLVRVQE